jgi:hypothetical protein
MKFNRLVSSSFANVAAADSLAQECDLVDYYLKLLHKAQKTDAVATFLVITRIFHKSSSVCPCQAQVVPP